MCALRNVNDVCIAEQGEETGVVSMFTSRRQLWATSLRHDSWEC
jgi:hypothetical protein